MGACHNILPQGRNMGFKKITNEVGRGKKMYCITRRWDLRRFSMLRNGILETVRLEVQFPGERLERCFNTTHLCHSK